MATKKKAKTKSKQDDKFDISLERLLEAGCHFGHQSQRWHPNIEPYIYTARDGIHIFDLVKTKKGLEEALEFVRQKAAEGKVILFVGTKRQAEAIIKEEAQKIQIPYVSERWLGGTITNWVEMKKRISKLARMKEEKEKGEYEKYTKKEQLLLDREIRRLDRFFGGLASLEKVPDVIFVVDIKKEKTAIREARRRKIPIVALVDSNADPSLVDYVIPANDDAVGSIKLIVSAIAGAVRQGKEIYSKKGKSDSGKKQSKTKTSK